MSQAFYLINVSQILLLLTVVCLVVGLFRYPHAARQDLLAATLVILAGVVVREFPVNYCGLYGWQSSCHWVAVAGKLLMIVGGIFFVRGSVQDYCRPWVWPCIILCVVATAVVV